MQLSVLFLRKICSIEKKPNEEQLDTKEKKIEIKIKIKIQNKFKFSSNYKFLLKKIHSQLLQNKNKRKILKKASISNLQSIQAVQQIHNNLPVLALTLRYITKSSV